MRIGIDVGGSAIKWAVLDGEHVERDGSGPTPRDGAESVLAAVVAIARAEAPVSSVGLALPAVVDPGGDATLMAPNLPGDWAGRVVAPPLRAELGVPVTLCNDARAFTLAEWRLGAARGRRDALGLTLGTGVGGGIVSDGRVVEGPRGQAGELGHLPVDEEGEPCGCGATGCLETLAGAHALLREARRTMPAAPTSAEALADAARAGDAAAGAILERAGAAIGRALAVLATALTPEVVVVGGGLSAALDLLRPGIETRFHERRAFIGHCPVVASALGTRAGAIGAALWERR